MTQNTKERELHFDDEFEGLTGRDADRYAEVRKQRQGGDYAYAYFGPQNRSLLAMCK